MVGDGSGVVGQVAGWRRIVDPRHSMAPWLGMACPYAWIAWLLTSGGGDGIGMSPVNGPYPALVIACAAIAVVACMGARCRIPEFEGKVRATRDAAMGFGRARLLDVCAALLLAIATVAVGFGGAASVAHIVAVTTGGVGMAWMYARWVQVFSTLDLRRAVGAICGSVALAACFKCVLLPMRGVTGAVVSLALVLVGFFLLRACHAGCAVGESGTADPVANAARQSPHPVACVSSHAVALDGHVWQELHRAIIALVGFSLVLGVVYGFPREGRDASGGLLFVAGYASELLAALAVWWWVCVRRRSIDITGIFAALAVVVALGLVLMALFSVDASAPFFLLTNIDHSLLTMFLWIVLVDVAQRLARPNALVVAAAGWGLRSASFVVGGVLTQVLKLAASPSLCLVLVFAVLVLLVSVVVGRHVGTERILERLVERAAATGLMAGGETVDERCAELALAYGLTDREREVMTLLCKGRSRPYIAETLYLSENTVRGHTKHIYEKLGIHDRQSLLSLVDEVRPGSGR